YDLTYLRCSVTAFLTWLLASSANSLRILEMREISCTGITHTLAHYVPPLRSLRLLHYNVHSAVLLRMCTALEESVLNSVPTCFPLASELPPTIEHLALGKYRSSFQPVMEAVDILPKLRVLTCVSYPEQHDADYDTLKAKCRMKGAVVSHDEDPVIVKQFSRTRSVSNFGAMS
ncbi:hypothetical protein EDB19DRAFT_1640461, partial [Suillus lakei]